MSFVFLLQQSRKRGYLHASAVPINFIGSSRLVKSNTTMENSSNTLFNPSADTEEARMRE